MGKAMQATSPPASGHRSSSSASGSLLPSSPQLHDYPPGHVSDSPDPSRPRAAVDLAGQISSSARVPALLFFAGGVGCGNGDAAPSPRGMDVPSCMLLLFLVVRPWIMRELAHSLGGEYAGSYVDAISRPGYWEIAHDVTAHRHCNLAA